MNEPDDLALLREYAAQSSESAFAELVSRRVDFVYSAALRQTRDPHLAEEITQAVFILLAQKAGKISDKTILTGWLFKTTRFTALAQIRAETKRSLQTATIIKEFQMQNEIQPVTTDEFWEQMSPLLDEALAALGETDRQAVLLRFFENKSLAEVGEFLGIGEDTARKRISRALEKLHRYFHRRGVSSTTAIIAGAISTNSIHAAPMGLAKTISAAAITKGAAASSSTLTLIKGALKIMAWTKAKTAIVASVVVLLAAGTTTVVVKVVNERPIVIQGKTESEWINSIVYFGDDNQLRLWHSFGPKGVQMLLRALKPPQAGLDEEQAFASRKTRMNVASVLSQLADYKLGNDVKAAIPEIINDIKIEKDNGVLGIELGLFEMPIQSMSENEKAALFPELLRAMQRNDSAVRNNALVALQYYPDQAKMVIPLMVKSLQDSSPQVRLMAVKALNKIDPENDAKSGFVSVLAGCVAGPSGDTPGAANDAVIMLGALHREPGIAVPVLIQCLQNADTYIRQNAAAALGKFGGQAKSAIPALQKALGDSDAHVRNQAATALKLINS